MQPHSLACSTQVCSNRGPYMALMGTGLHTYTPGQRQDSMLLVALHSASCGSMRAPLFSSVGPHCSMHCRPMLSVCCPSWHVYSCLRRTISCRAHGTLVCRNTSSPPTGKAGSCTRCHTTTAAARCYTDHASVLEQTSLHSHGCTGVDRLAVCSLSMCSKQCQCTALTPSAPSCSAWSRRSQGPMYA